MRPLRVEAEMVERRRELHAAARDVRMRRARAQARVDRDLLGGLAHRRVVGADQAGFDRGLRLGAAFEQAALDQQAIGALAGGSCGTRVVMTLRKRGIQ